MNTTVSQQSPVILQDHKDVLIYQFRLLETLPPNERGTVLNYLSSAWCLSTESTLPLDQYNVQYRYTMYSEVTRERYSFLVQMDPIQGTMHSITFEGHVSTVAA